MQSTSDPVGAARQLVPLVRTERDECDRLRHLSPRMVEALAQAGLLQMYLPRGLGGVEVPPLTAFAAIEEISKADGSIGWCVMLASLLAAFTAWLPPASGRTMAGAPADLRLAGSIRPQGKARIVSGGYRVTGQWDFASGIHGARWVVCPCVVLEGDRPVITAAGTPRTRIMWLPADRMKIVDTWNVIGLRATGSHDFTVEDEFIAEPFSSSLADPPQHTGPLFVPRLFFPWVWTATVANSLGIARGAIDAFVEFAGSHSSSSSAALLRDRPLVQTRVAEAEATLNSARAYLIDTIGAVWTRVCTGSEDLDTPILQARLAITHAMHAAARTVDLVFHAAGTNAIYARNPLERYFRDIHVTVQHGAALPQHFEAAGKALMGIRPTDPGW